MREHSACYARGMSGPMTLQALQSLEPGSSRRLTAGMVGLLTVGLHLPGRGLHFEVEGWETIPDAPTVMVCNHTHWLDWIALRWVGYWRHRTLCNWVKPRTYEEGWDRFLNKTGNIPVVSRGYLISADVRSLCGEPPDETQYRVLRDHLDEGTPLPEGAFFDKIASTPRDILGIRFDPSAEDWRACVERLFHQMMEATLAHTRTLCAQGIDLQIMPQGVTSMRLTHGHPGALQAALALDLPIVPVGINGFPQAYGEKGRIFPKPGGTVVMRIGEAYRPDPIEGLVPFLPSSEREHAEALQAGTEAMMSRIEKLLDPQHGPAASEDEADVVGVARFV